MGTAEEGSGYMCPVIHWSNPTIKDIAKRRRDGIAKTKHLIADTVPDLYKKHMFSEHLVKEFDRNGREKRIWKRIGKRPNHLWDCYCMQITLACIKKIIGKD